MTIEKGFSNRMKKMQAIRMLGSGMDLGELNEYAFEICFLLIQKKSLSKKPTSKSN